MQFMACDQWNYFSGYLSEQKRVAKAEKDNQYAILQQPPFDERHKRTVGLREQLISKEVGDPMQ